MSKLLLGFLLLLSTLVPGCSSSTRNDDVDVDGVRDDIDNCPWVSNSDQADINGNGVGDACDFCEVASLAADIWPGEKSSGLRYLTSLGDKIYFQGDDGVHGDELWVYDPMEGASLVVDIVPGIGDSRPDELTALDGKLYFQTHYDTSDGGLWVYDPATPTASAVMVADVKIVSYSGTVTLDGKLFFTGSEGEGDFDYELWMYDPAVGVSRVSDIWPGKRGSAPHEFTVFDGKLFFTAFVDYGQELWFYDPITADLNQVDINSIPDGDGNYLYGLTVLDSKLYFSANDGMHGQELWVYAAEAGASLVADINSGIEHSYPEAFTTLDGKLYLVADDGVHGRELWTYDPTSGATLASDIYPGERHGFLRSFQLVQFKGTLFFIGFDDIHGEELWSYNPASGAMLVADTVPGVGGFGDEDPEPPSDLRVFENKFYFQAFDNASENDSTLWIYDPVSGPEILNEVWPGTDITQLPYTFTELNGKQYFVWGDEDHGRELWVYDPACAG